jgi:holo-[acyl-carrier protein] synthase
MIISIGCDLVEHQITKKLNWESDIETIKTIFSEKELELYKRETAIKFLSGRFAAKEAVLKCLSIGMRDGIMLTEIEILRGEKGVPNLVINGTVKKYADNFGINYWHLSITHSSNYSFAMVVAEK